MFTWDRDSSWTRMNNCGQSKDFSSFRPRQEDKKRAKALSPLGCNSLDSATSTVLSTGLTLASLARPFWCPDKWGPCHCRRVRPWPPILIRIHQVKWTPASWRQIQNARERNHAEFPMRLGPFPLARVSSHFPRFVSDFPPCLWWCRLFFPFSQRLVFLRDPS